MKFCVECKHAKSKQHSATPLMWTWFCHHPELLWRPGPDPVTGVITEPQPLTCDENRHGHHCSLAATHWEAKI